MYAPPGGGGVVPPCLLEESRVPPFYREAIVGCGAVSTSHMPNTPLVYNLMLRSGLPRALLGQIWAMVNRTLPGQLTRGEFFSCLALIALAQKGEPLSALSTVTMLPVPLLHFPVAAETNGSARVAEPTISFLGLNGPVPRAPVAIPLGQPMPASLSAGLLQPTRVRGDGPSSAGRDAMKASARMQVQSASPGCSHEAPEDHAIAPAREKDNNATAFTNGHLGKDVGMDVLEPTVLSQNGFEMEKDEREMVWMRLLREVQTLFDDARRWCSSTDAREIAATECGARHVRALALIAEIVARIARSSNERFAGREVQRMIEDVESKWNAMRHFNETREEQVDVLATTGERCGICLQIVPQEGSLSFSARVYHPPCANFWVNRVDSLLPSLD